MWALICLDGIDNFRLPGGSRPSSLFVQWGVLRRKSTNDPVRNHSQCLQWVSTLGKSGISFGKMRRNKVKTLFVNSLKSMTVPVLIYRPVGVGPFVVCVWFSVYVSPLDTCASSGTWYWTRNSRHTLTFSVCLLNGQSLSKQKDQNFYIRNLNI